MITTLRASLKVEERTDSDGRQAQWRSPFETNLESTIELKFFNWSMRAGGWDGLAPGKDSSRETAGPALFGL